MDKMKMETVNITEQNIDKIAALFPNCITEASDGNGGIKRAVNFDLLRQMLSGDVVESDEAYEFTWVGKKAAIVEANKPIRKTLRPCTEESVDWDHTENLYIEGDNLEVLKLLQESYLGKIKMIYIDPPYNTGHDFIYPDSYLMTLDEYDDITGFYNKDGKINYTRENSTFASRYHSDWCSMIYSRLILSRNLLREDGLIFISIDDNEIFNMQKIANEIFGESNFLACFPRVTKKAGKTTEAIAKNHDYVLAYSKNEHPQFFLPFHTDEGFKYEDEYVESRGKYKLNQTLDYDSLSYSSSLDYPLSIEGEIFYPGQSKEKYIERQAGNHARADWAWRWSKELFDFGYKNGFVVIKKSNGSARIYTKTYQNARIVKIGDEFSIEYINRTRAISSLEFVENEFSNDNAKKNLSRLFDASVFDYSKPVSLVQTLLKYTSRNDDLILDFFSGSATTAQAVLNLNAEDGGNRKFIMIQLDEPCDEKSEAYRAGYKNICEVGQERIRRSGKKIKEVSDEKARNLDIGFRVFKLDDSNMKDVYYAAGDYGQDMISMMESNIKEDRTDLDLLFGCLLEWGLPLSLPYTSEEIDGYTVHTYNDGDLIACFDENIPDSVVKTIARRQPLRAVFRDCSFADSPSKINVAEVFKLLAPDTRVKVI